MTLNLSQQQRLLHIQQQLAMGVFTFVQYHVALYSVYGE